MIANQNAVEALDEKDSGVESSDYFAPTGRLLNALTTVLDETLERFEAASGKVTETVLTRNQPEDHELIVALQDFDRIHQEFSAIKSVLSHYATNPPNIDSDTVGPGRDAISMVTLTHLKNRLLDCFGGETSCLDVEPPDEEAVF